MTGETPMTERQRQLSEALDKWLSSPAGQEALEEGLKRAEMSAERVRKASMPDRDSLSEPITF